MIKRLVAPLSLATLGAFTLCARGQGALPEGAGQEIVQTNCAG
jgi:hypothetical protein